LNNSESGVGLYLGKRILNRAVTVGPTTPITMRISVSYSLDDTSWLVVEGQMELKDDPQVFSLATLNPTLNFLQSVGYFLSSYSSSINITDYRRGSCDNETSISSSLLLHVSSPSSSPLSCSVGGTILSRPFFESMMWCLKESDNLYAELYMRQLGMQMNGNIQGSSYDKSISAVAQILTQQLGINGTLFHQMDGSGLSRHNLVTPVGLIQVLQAMADSVNDELYLSFLPIAGVDGTLSDRFVGTPAQGILHAKTGSEGGVNALSGWVFPPSFGSAVVFSILSNQASVSADRVRHAIDAIGIALAELVQC